MKNLILNRSFNGLSSTNLTGQCAQRGSLLLKRLKLTLIVAGLFAGIAEKARASDPIGIYAFVDKVVFEPGESSPERIQIWGGFAVAEGMGYDYATAARGYLYLTIK